MSDSAAAADPQPPAAAAAAAAPAEAALTPAEIISKMVETKDPALIQQLPAEMQTPEVIQDLMGAILGHMQQQDSMIEQVRQQNALTIEAMVNGVTDSLVASTPEAEGYTADEVRPHVQQALTAYFSQLPMHTPEGQRAVQAVQACAQAKSDHFARLQADNAELRKKVEELESRAKTQATRDTFKRALAQTVMTTSDMVSPWAQPKTATVAASAASAAAAEPAAEPEPKKQRQEEPAAPWADKVRELTQRRAQQAGSTLHPDLGFHVPDPHRHPLSHQMFQRDQQAYLRLQGHAADRPMPGGGLSAAVTEALLQQRRAGTVRDLGRTLPVGQPTQ